MNNPITSLIWLIAYGVWFIIRTISWLLDVATSPPWPSCRSPREVPRRRHNDRRHV